MRVVKFLESNKYVTDFAPTKRIYQVELCFTGKVLCLHALVRLRDYFVNICLLMYQLRELWKKVRDFA